MNMTSCDSCFGFHLLLRFICLITTGEPGDYIRGEAKATRRDAQAAARALAKFKSGTIWRMRRPKLMTDMKTQYISSPIKFVIDMSAASFEAMPDSQALGHAVPSLTVAEVSQLSPSCTFDLKGFVTSCSGLRDAGSERKVMDISLMDGSDCEGRVASLTIAVFGADQDPIFAFLQTLVKTGHPLLFYGLQGKKTDRGFNVSNSREYHCVKAPDDVTMLGSWDALTGMEADDKFCMDSGYEVDHDVDYTNEPAFQTCVCVVDKHLGLIQVLSSRYSTLMSDEGVVQRLYQINWAELSPPSSQSALQSTKGSLFYRATLRDCTGQMEVFVREKAALSMSSMPSAQAFLAAVEEQDLVVPLLVSLRLVCRSGKDDGKPIFVVVEATAQNLDEPPSNASQWLFPLIGACPEAAARVLPARVADLKSSPLYALMVGENVVTKALVLLISTEKSKLAQCGEGYFVHTKGLRDAMAADESNRFSAKALCTLSNSIQFKLDPPPGKEQGILAMVQGLQQTTEGLVLLLSGVSHIREMDEVKKAFQSYMDFTQKVQGTARSKRPLQWTPETAKTCRRLSRSPTDT
eukprot:s390_g6.t1